MTQRLNNNTKSVYPREYRKILDNNLTMVIQMLPSSFYFLSIFQLKITLHRIEPVTKDKIPCMPDQTYILGFHSCLSYPHMCHNCHMESGSQLTLLSLFSRQVASVSLPPHGLQPARLPCLSLSPGVYLTAQKPLFQTLLLKKPRLRQYFQIILSACCRCIGIQPLKY